VRDAQIAAIRQVGKSSSSDIGDVKAVVLMGSEHSFGNGINPNTIEASEDPGKVGGA